MRLPCGEAKVDLAKSAYKALIFNYNLLKTGIEFKNY